MNKVLSPERPTPTEQIKQTTPNDESSAGGQMTTATNEPSMLVVLALGAIIHYPEARAQVRDLGCAVLFPAGFPRNLAAAILDDDVFEFVPVDDQAPDYSREWIRLLECHSPVLECEPASSAWACNVLRALARERGADLIAEVLRWAAENVKRLGVEAVLKEITRTLAMIDAHGAAVAVVRETSDEGVPCVRFAEQIAKERQREHIARRSCPQPENRRVSSANTHPGRR